MKRLLAVCCLIAFLPGCTTDSQVDADVTTPAPAAQAGEPCCSDAGEPAGGCCADKAPEASGKARDEKPSGACCEGGVKPKPAGSQ
jgi:hypothetical protein